MSPDDLSEEETSLLRGLLRQALRKQGRAKRALEARWGSDTDLSAPRARALMLEATYRRLGGHPENIDNLERWWEA